MLVFLWAHRFLWGDVVLRSHPIRDELLSYIADDVIRVSRFVTDAYREPSSAGHYLTEECVGG